VGGAFAAWVFAIGAKNQKTPQKQSKELPAKSFGKF
jgi:hypothetical protein